ncbi:Disulfide-bond oxidoreductase [Lachnellula suecica]|uniref:Disulfide-bond oxidoreductase n=1 Tax=Lachnellula suecica TaxID=602035 RepID=A0A8T9CKW0_9HELO|nr:Disulfide-bond oxidoreductase [Lachnellula suecica]
MSSSARPTGLIAKSGIELLTFGTPNGHKASIILEELKEAYGKDYVFQSINIMENIQKEAWFTKHSPNGRIPAIVDHDRNEFSVFEGAAILTYLTRHYDPEHKFCFADADDISRAEQWVAWQHGGLGPMQGQANHFYHRIPYPTQRYVGESERLYGVLDTQLKDRDYLVGPGRGKYSIADIASFSWVNVSYFAGLDLAQFPNVHRWWQAILERPAVKKGLEVPSKSPIVNSAIPERLETDKEFKEKDDELKKKGEEAKKQFNYKFSSP